MNKKVSHSEEELISIFKLAGINEKYFSKFLKHYKHCYDELYEDYKNFEDDDFEEGDSVQASALWCTNGYIKSYLELIDKGHSEEWAHEMASTVNEGASAISSVYDDIERNNPELAKKDLLIYTKSLGGDEFFEKHYMFLFEVSSNPYTRIETAKNYSLLYKSELNKGKSEVYAHHYADLMSMEEYHEIYCEEYAFAFDKAKNDNKSEDYARVYAEKYASALVDIKRRHGISDDEAMIDFAIEKVEAYMESWSNSNQN